MPELHIPDLFAGGRIIDWVVGLVALEAVALLAWRAATGRGPAPLALIGNLLAGMFLLLALRNALIGDSGVRIGLCLLGALGAHRADLAGRWDGSRARAPPAASRPPKSPTISNATISLRVQKSPNSRKKP